MELSANEIVVGRELIRKESGKTWKVVGVEKSYILQNPTGESTTQVGEKELLETFESTKRKGDSK